MRYILIALILFSNVAFAEDDDYFLDEPENTKPVNFNETTYSRWISIKTIRMAQVVDKYALKPTAIGYDAVSTKNFQRSSKNAFDNLLYGIRIPNAIFIGSSDRLISSFGNILLNASMGIFATANITEELNISNNQTKIVDIVRFYNSPEVFFVSLGGIFNVTLPYLLTDIAEIYIIDELGIFWGVGLDIMFYTINERALNPAPFDLLQKINPELAYDTLKAQAYGEAKNFQIKRNLFQQHRQSLSMAYSKYDDF